MAVAPLPPFQPPPYPKHDPTTYPTAGIIWLRQNVLKILGYPGKGDERRETMTDDES